MSHTFLYKKLDEYGANHNKKIVEKIAAEEKRLKAEFAHKDDNDDEQEKDKDNAMENTVYNQMLVEKLSLITLILNKMCTT